MLFLKKEEKKVSIVAKRKGKVVLDEELTYLSPPASMQHLPFLWQQGSS
jgi:hypothetical protein